MHHLNQNPWTSSKTQNSKLAASSIHSPSTHSILFFSTDQGQCEVGHFGLTVLAPTQNISLGLWALDSWMLPTLQEEVMWWWGWGARKKSGLRELKTKPSMWLVVWTEAKARTEGRRRGRTEREEGGRDGGLPSRLLSALWRGSWGCQICGASRCWLAACVCEYPSVYLSVPMCVHLSTTLYMCVLGEVHNCPHGYECVLPFHVSRVVFSKCDGSWSCLPAWAASERLILDNTF